MCSTVSMRALQCGHSRWSRGTPCPPTTVQHGSHRKVGAEGAWWARPSHAATEVAQLPAGRAAGMRQRNLRGRPPALPERQIGVAPQVGGAVVVGERLGAGGGEVGVLVAQVGVQRALKNDVPRVLYQPWPAVAGAVLAGALC